MKLTFARKLLEQGIAASKASQSRDARRLLLNAVELDPGSEMAWIWLSGAMDDLSKRRYCLERVLELNPHNVHARAGLAWLERQSAHQVSTEAAPSAPLDDAAKLDRDVSFPDAYVRLGEARKMSGDGDGARASFADPLNAHLALGRIYERRHQWNDALKEYEHALTIDKSSAAAELALGRLLMEGKSFKAAFPRVLRATKLGPDRAEAWFLLGLLYEMAQEHRKAIQAYQRATDLVKRGKADNATWSRRASARLESLRPSLPPKVTLNWPETFRQTAGMILIPALAALVNGGLRPWWITPTDYLGLLVAALGAYFWVSALSMPRNPGMRAMLGQGGLSSPTLRAVIGVLGGLFWVMGLLHILMSPALTRGFWAG